MWSADELRSMAEAHYKGFAGFQSETRSSMRTRSR